MIHLKRVVLKQAFGERIRPTVIHWATLEGPGRHKPVLVLIRPRTVLSGQRHAEEGHRHTIESGRKRARSSRHLRQRRPTPEVDKIGKSH